MKKKIITHGPSFDNLIDALWRRDTRHFTIDGEVQEVIPSGLEAVEGEPGTYDLKVNVLGLKMPGYQHFRYCPANGQGEWVGYFELGHKAYEGHSIVWS